MRRPRLSESPLRLLRRYDGPARPLAGTAISRRACRARPRNHAVELREAGADGGGRVGGARHLPTRWHRLAVRCLPQVPAGPVGDDRRCGAQARGGATTPAEALRPGPLPQLHGRHRRRLAEAEAWRADSCSTCAASGPTSESSEASGRRAIRFSAPLIATSSTWSGASSATPMQSSASATMPSTKSCPGQPTGGRQPRSPLSLAASISLYSLKARREFAATRKRLSHR